MFAPYCATCGTRRLLPVTRIMASDWERGGPIHVRCTCGSVIDADCPPPERPGLAASIAQQPGRADGTRDPSAPTAA